MDKLVEELHKGLLEDVSAAVRSAASESENPSQDEEDEGKVSQNQPSAHSPTTSETDYAVLLEDFLEHLSLLPDHLGRGCEIMMVRAVCRNLLPGSGAQIMLLEPLDRCIRRDLKFAFRLCFNLAILAEQEPSRLHTPDPSENDSSVSSDSSAPNDNSGHSCVKPETATVFIWVKWKEGCLAFIGDIA
jgi:hypothetical protein